MSVHQDFRQDIFDALVSGVVWLKKYKDVKFVFAEPTKLPMSILDGARNFCTRYNMPLQVMHNVEEVELLSQAVYILTSEDDLAWLIKKVRQSSFVLGKDIGIISFNETIFKELLDITVITTDFEQMGRTAAELILHRNHLQVKNPFKMIKRNSL